MYKRYSVIITIKSVKPRINRDPRDVRGVIEQHAKNLGVRGKGQASEGAGCGQSRWSESTHRQSEWGRRWVSMATSQELLSYWDFGLYLMSKLEPKREK